ncbi:hypothetical protein EJ05DRAFT_315243 [Pseudovirgaria hyperparasitica]|uniref:Rhodopsin domain-containing protein n=1 Tax=Pseudovirgaria hyperparasitica TaxID=470096 RepID=A0A6A6WEB5_9PEZI|nr:uncharacterized protein EJ05DRAFT_315243 [Pseudovirgaria hyperparasitica]KAF2759927.1 hypothetical protein EJ05DRAFT_315243 [Pseudovirgaria hyperparasitica]
MVSPRGEALAAWLSVFTVLTVGVLILRFYAVRIQQRALRSDDYLVAGATIAMLVLEGCTFWAIHNGLGARAATLDWPQQAVQIKLMVSAFWTWTIATTGCKLAVLRLYLAIFHTKTFRYINFVLMGLVACYPFVFIPVFMTQCTPVSAAWDPVLSLTHCRPREQHELASVAVNVAFDLLIVLLPLPWIWSLQMATRRKVTVTAMFSLGLSIVGVMIWRLVTTALPNPNPDFTYDVYILALQSHLELWLGLLAASLPTLAPLLSRMVPENVKSYFKGSSVRSPKRNNMIRSFGQGRFPRTKAKSDLDSIDGLDIPLHSIERRQYIQVSYGKNDSKASEQGKPVGVEL